MNIENILINDTKLSNLLKDKLDDIHLLKLNFSLYIANKKSKNKFIIDLDEIYKWIGFSRKDNAKRLLNNGFIINEDYIVELDKRENNNIKGGLNKEKKFLTIKCFTPLHI
jgi:hypothetical protein